MTATFYKIDCPITVLDKTSLLSNQAQAVTIEPYEPIDDLRGYIITSSTYDDDNYVKIDSVAGKDRYYFVTGRELMTAGRCKIMLEEDVLMTWHSVIEDTECVISRTGNSGWKDMGNDIPLMSYSIISDDAFSTELEITGDEYVVFSACSGSVAASRSNNSSDLPNTGNGAGLQEKPENFRWGGEGSNG